MLYTDSQHTKQKRFTHPLKRETAACSSQGKPRLVFMDIFSLAGHKLSGSGFGWVYESVWFSTRFFFHTKSHSNQYFNSNCMLGSFSGALMFNYSMLWENNLITNLRLSRNHGIFFFFFDGALSLVKKCTSGHVIWYKEPLMWYLLLAEHVTVSFGFVGELKSNQDNLTQQLDINADTQLPTPTNVGSCTLDSTQRIMQIT